MPKRAKREPYPALPDFRLRPTGPLDADGMLVGEAGGESEHYGHPPRPFIGKAGRVLNAYLRFVHIPRPNVRVTNVYPFWTGPGNPDPLPWQIHEHEWRLQHEIELVNPKVIGCLGRIAAEWFLGPIKMEDVHGIPHFSDRAPNAIILPVYHPAAGFYEPAKAKDCQDDIRIFAHLLSTLDADRPTPPVIDVVLDRRPPVWA